MWMRLLCWLEFTYLNCKIIISRNEYFRLFEVKDNPTRKKNMLSVCRKRGNYNKRWKIVMHSPNLYSELIFYNFLENVCRVNKTFWKTFWRNCTCIVFKSFSRTWNFLKKSKLSFFQFPNRAWKWNLDWEYHLVIW